VIVLRIKDISASACWTAKSHHGLCVVRHVGQPQNHQHVHQ